MKTKTALIPVWALPALLEGDRTDLDGDEKAELADWEARHPEALVTVLDPTETHEQHPEFGQDYPCVHARVEYA